jgi:Holliday junction resolvase RusA-like endonuclease
MKHYKELSEIENISIDLEVFASAVRVMSFGATEACKRDVDNMMHHISSELDKINAKLGHSFNELWESVRKETFDDTKEDEV